MERTRVYVETTIPSFYHEARTAPGVLARRDWTRQWWGEAVGRDDLVTSVAVLDELEGGPSDHHAAWLSLMRDLPLLTIDAAIFEIVASYVRHRLMPADPAGDALHLAVASYHQVRFSGNVELPSPGERQQIRSYPQSEHDARTLRAHSGYASRTARRSRWLKKEMTR